MTQNTLAEFIAWRHGVTVTCTNKECPHLAETGNAFKRRLPLKELAETYGAHRTFDEILPRLTCSQCGSHKFSMIVDLERAPSGMTGYGGESLRKPVRSST